MSEIVLGGRDKKKFVMFTSIALAALIWIMPDSIQQLDFSTISIAQLFTGATGVIAGATLLYHSRIDERIDKRLKAQADKGAWRGEGREKGFLIESIAKLNVHTNPWFSPNWESIYGDRDKVLDDVLGGTIVQTRLWSIKVGLATGITVTIGIIRLSFIIGIFVAILAFLAGIVIIYSTITKKEFTELPTLVQKLAIHRFLTDQTEATMSRLQEIPESNAVLTLNEQMKEISSSCNELNTLIEEKRWSIFETRLMLLIQRLDNGLYTQTLHEIMERELSNAWITTLLGLSSDESIRKRGGRFEEYVAKIRRNIEIAYSSSGYPPEWLRPWLEYDASSAQLDSVIQMVDFDKLNERTVHRLSSYFFGGDPQILGSTLENGATRWVQVDIPERFGRLVYSFYNSERVPSSTRNSPEVSMFIALKCWMFVKPANVEPHVVEAIVNNLGAVRGEDFDNLTRKLVSIARQGGKNYSARFAVLKHLNEFISVGFVDLLQSDLDTLMDEIVSSIVESSQRLSLLQSLPEELSKDVRIISAISTDIEALEKEILLSYRINEPLKGVFQTSLHLKDPRILEAIVSRIRSSEDPSFEISALSEYSSLTKIPEIESAIQRSIPRLLEEIDKSHSPVKTLDKVRGIEVVYSDTRIAAIENEIAERKRRKRIYARRIRSTTLLMLITTFFTLVIMMSYYEGISVDSVFLFVGFIIAAISIVIALYTVLVRKL